MSDVFALLVAFTLLGVFFALGCRLTRRRILKDAPDFVDERHRDDYRYWYVEWCKAVEWLQRNPRVPTVRRPAVPPVIAVGSVVPVDFKRRARRAA